MKMRLAILLSVAICWGASAVGPSASAQSPYWADAWWFYGGGYGGDLWRDLPYFAAFPPVYYQGITPRTYGYSPFAMLGDAPYSGLSCAAPQVVVNQYAARATAVQPGANAGEAGPLLIRNPYVKK